MLRFLFISTKQKYTDTGQSKWWGVIFTKSIIKAYSSVYLMTRVVRLHLPNCWHSVTTVTPVISGSPLPSSKIWHSASFTDFSAVSKTFSAGPCSCPTIWHHSWRVNRFISKHQQEIWKVHGIAPALLTYILFDMCHLNLRVVVYQQNSLLPSSNLEPAFKNTCQRKLKQNQMTHMYRITSLSNAFVDLTYQKHATVSGEYRNQYWHAADKKSGNTYV